MSHELALEETLCGITLLQKISYVVHTSYMDLGMFNCGPHSLSKKHFVVRSINTGFMVPVLFETLCQDDGISQCRNWMMQGRLG